MDIVSGIFAGFLNNTIQWRVVNGTIESEPPTPENSQAG
jgi:hypothetical protein